MSNGDNPLHYEPGVDYPAEGLDLLREMHNGTWLAAQEFPPVEYAVPGIVPEGLVLNVGAPKVGKSALVLGYGLAVASGGIALGRLSVGPSRPVLYLALEDGFRRLQERCRALLGPDAAIPAELDMLTKVRPIEIVPTIKVWLDYHRTERPLVILDVLGKAMTPAKPGEDRYARDYRVMESLADSIRGISGATLLANHHDRKAHSEDFVDAVSGSHGLAGAADTTVVIVRNRLETTGLMHVTGRDVAEGEYALNFTYPQWILDGQDLDEAAKNAAKIKATAGLGDRSAEIIGLATARGQVRAGDVIEALGEKPDQARIYLNRLADSGRLQKLGRGLYGPVTSVTSVTSDNPRYRHNTPYESGDPWKRNNVTDVTPTHSGSESDPARCEACRFPLDPVLVTAGFTTHPTCDGAA